MTSITHIPPVGQPAPYDDDSNVKPVSAGGDPTEGRLASEMSATLQDWLHGLPARSARRRRSHDQTRNSRT